jgi:hypothetical protein
VIDARAGARFLAHALEQGTALFWRELQVGAQVLDRYVSAQDWVFCQQHPPHGASAKLLLDAVAAYSRWQRALAVHGQRETYPELGARVTLFVCGVIEAI